MIHRPKDQELWTPTRREFLKMAGVAGMSMMMPRMTMEFGQTELIHTIRRCGLTSGLKLCLDAGDVNSYSGSGQSWLDTSGNGYDFFRGATSSAAGDDPTFNGTAGRRSSGEYWSFDGGDFFRYDSANEAWMENLHKSSAKFTLLAWLYSPLTIDGGIFACAEESTSSIGIEWMVRSGDHLLEVLNGSGVSYQQNISISGSNAWHLCAVSLDEAVGANGAIFFFDGTTALKSSTYTSPSTSSASRTYEIGAMGGGALPFANGSRLGMFAAWEGVALTQAQLLALYQQTRGHFGV